MDMFFEKIHSEEKCEDNGRPLAFFFVSAALVYFEDEVKEKEDGGRKEKGRGGVRGTANTKGAVRFLQRRRRGSAEKLFFTGAK